MGVYTTRVTSFTGPWLYSDWGYRIDDFQQKEKQDTKLNRFARIPMVGIVAGIVRIALGVIHTIGHLLAALVNLDKGHLLHAGKGGCELLRGIIESIPIIGRIFANAYSPDIDMYYASSKDQRYCHSLWLMKIKDPQNLDIVDYSLQKNDQNRVNNSSREFPIGIQVAL
ncbi:MAG: hypothetical protein EB127_18250 [Alphaproteobacteria bacterium]|nr:hypothetical protein [Alphaproteobacteria bacterium]